jgi:hypothetical protein
LAIFIIFVRLRAAGIEGRASARHLAIARGAIEARAEADVLAVVLDGRLR